MPGSKAAGAMATHPTNGSHATRPRDVSATGRCKPDFVRVGLIAPPWLPVPPPKYGGTESVIDALARGLIEAGHEVLLVTIGDSTCPVPRSSVIRHAEQGEFGLIEPALRHACHAYQAVRGCDVVHDHTFLGPLLARSSPAPVLTTNHGPFTSDVAQMLRTVVDHVGVIAISHHQASTAVGIPIAEVIHHGLALDTFPFGAGDGGYFAFLGRMTPEKGARRAVMAARACGARLLIAAKMREQSERVYFREQVEPLLDNRIRYIGEIDGRSKRDFLGRATALLNPIRWPEPFGLVMIESLACGTPVLTFGEGAAPEIVEDAVTGYVCTDDDDMVDTMRTVGKLSRRRCRKAAEDRFSMDRVVTEHLDTYRRFLG
jgi:glycosyltransferase involved in cell wall biosynthesis